MNPKNGVQWNNKANDPLEASMSTVPVPPVNAAALDLAYEFARQSYDWALQRYDAIDARIQTIMTAGVSLSLAAPVAFAALQVRLALGWPIYLAGVLFILGISIGTYGRLTGEVRLLTPKILYARWLGLDETEFKKNLVYFAGEAMEHNRATILRKHRFLVATLVIFALELVFLVAATVRGV